MDKLEAFTELMSSLVCDEIFYQRRVMTKDMLLEVLNKCVLGSGTTLIVGGVKSNQYQVQNTMERRQGNSWFTVEPFPSVTSGHAMTRMLNNDVLLAGGQIVHVARSICKRYRPSMGKWLSVDALKFPRFYHTAVTLETGEAMAAGGVSMVDDEGTEMTDSIEFLDPETMCWSSRPELVLPLVLAQHCAVTLTNGDVLFMGGMTFMGMFRGGKRIVTDRCFIYNHRTGVFREVSRMKSPRTSHTAILIPNGDIMVIGGYEERRFIYDGKHVTAPVSSCEIYTPATDTWTLTTPMPKARARHCCFLVAEGVMIVGGCSSSAYYEQDDIENQGAIFNYDKKTWRTNIFVPVSATVNEGACASFL